MIDAIPEMGGGPEAVLGGPVFRFEPHESARVMREIDGILEEGLSVSAGISPTQVRVFAIEAAGTRIVWAGGETAEDAISNLLGLYNSGIRNGGAGTEILDRISGASLPSGRLDQVLHTGRNLSTRLTGEGVTVDIEEPGGVTTGLGQDFGTALTSALGEL